MSALKVWNGTAWEYAAAGDAPAVAHYQTTEPSAPAVGEIWVDSDDAGSPVPGAIGVITTGSAAPTGGNDGDWYNRIGVTSAGLYRKISGTWTRAGTLSTLFDDNPDMLTSPWTPYRTGASLNVSTASLAQVFNVSNTGFTKTTNSFAMSSAEGLGKWPGSKAGLMKVTVTALPSGGSLYFGIVNTVAPNAYVNVSPAGSATIDVSGAPQYTFPGTVTTGSANTFFVYATSGYVAVTQATINSVVGSIFYPNTYVPQSGFSAGNVGPYLGGVSGTVTVSNIEVYQ